ncbi:MULTISPECIES: DUF2093 domain-containing protein [Sphingomonas]|jgi:hypothetical protein|uniref:DUF2093 domain-containing protein n=1 Tax=Sphingomonas ginsenosidimutans TaxID=862134 RepID=A0A2A4I166_9SPHN|nr:MULTISPECIES: DUF2093 domain-containing protein [Sphingomonas]MBY0303168.1 DUF2093 domain-containing protein [Sphingomonas ginsenosidimutans]PCG10354.1 DUF2093 domain-containing protein [Sphingomonas ginsenosidimutans]
MLMSHADRAAKVHYMANGFRILSPGDHVLCAATDARIPLEDLRYWDVATQRPFASAAIAAQEMAPAR